MNRRPAESLVRRLRYHGITPTPEQYAAYREERRIIEGKPKRPPGRPRKHEMRAGAV